MTPTFSLLITYAHIEGELLLAQKVEKKNTTFIYFNSFRFLSTAKQMKEGKRGKTSTIYWARISPSSRLYGPSIGKDYLSSFFYVQWCGPRATHHCRLFGFSFLERFIEITIFLEEKSINYLLRYLQQSRPRFMDLQALFAGFFTHPTEWHRNRYRIGWLICLFVSKFTREMFSKATTNLCGVW